MPVALGHTELKSRGNLRPFYLRESEEAKELSLKETKKKDSLDPMRKFSKRRKEKKERKEESSSDRDDDEKRRHRKRRKKSKRDDERKSSKTSKSRHRNTIKSDDLQELRRRRQKREANESIRASALCAGGKQDDRKRSYQNQYNPGLSRR